MNQNQKIRYKRETANGFYNTVRERVYNYLQETGTQKTGGWKLVKKALLIGTIFSTSYTLILLDFAGNNALYFILWISLGFSIAGLGMNVMHDSNHGSFSSNKKVNDLLGWLMNLIGINPFIWKFQHNKMHHKYPNVQGLDEDLNMPGLIRLSPYMPRYRFHRFQKYYIWILYLSGTLVKACYRDFMVIRHVNKIGCFKDPKQYHLKYAEMLTWKLIYFTYLLAIPVFCHEGSFLKVLTGFIFMHFTIGLGIVIIDFLAHFGTECEFREPRADVLDDTWAEYQMKSAVNFATKSAFWNWYSGGLNHQIEHHLFPELSHVHYTKISRLVRQTANEFNVPYHLRKTFKGAVVSHYRMLDKMGRMPVHTAPKYIPEIH